MRRIVISVVALLVLFVAASVAYIEYAYPHAGLLNLVRGVRPSASWKQYCYQADDFCAKFPVVPTGQPSRNTST